MQLSGKVIFRRTVLLDVIFFTPFVCYLWIIIEPRLIYHAFGILTEVPALRVDWPYLLEQFTRPGGTADYVAAILSNTYCYSFIGAAVVTTVAWILAAGTRTL